MVHDDICTYVYVMDGCDRMRNADADVSICNQIIKRPSEEIVVVHRRIIIQIKHASSRN